MNTRKIKRIINTLVALLLLLLFSMLLISFINKPEIKDIRFTNLNEISKSNIETQTNEVTSINEADFNYTIVGYRFGESNSSVILKKGSKEFVLTTDGDVTRTESQRCCTIEAVNSRKEPFNSIVTNS